LGLNNSAVKDKSASTGQARMYETSEIIPLHCSADGWSYPADEGQQGESGSLGFYLITWK